jgi:Flp pilus assembly pilin Flp
VVGTVILVGYVRAMSRRSASESGQTQSEFSLIVAAIAIGCIVAVLVFGGALGGLWDRSTKPVGPSTFNPPTATPSTPASASDCDDPGWASYGFDDKAACLTWVADNIP